MITLTVRHACVSKDAKNDKAKLDAFIKDIYEVHSRTDLKKVRDLIRAADKMEASLDANSKLVEQ